MTVAPRIFISYQREDETQAKELYHNLAAHGFHPWMDVEDLHPGENWRLAIEKAISKSDFFLALFSHNSVNKRGFAQQEIKAALRLWDRKLESDIFLIPVRLDPSAELPEVMSRFQCLNLYEADGWNKLLKAIEIGQQRRVATIEAIVTQSLPFDPSLASEITDDLEVEIKRPIPKEWEFAINQLATIPERRRAARAAQIELDTRHLEACGDVIAISNVYHQLAAGQYEGEVSAFLRNFSYLSQDVDAALAKESAYNQRLAFNAVAERLGGLSRQLIRNNERFDARFREIAESWRRIVNTQIRKLTETIEEQQEVDSPYIIGTPLTEKEEIFVGRVAASLRIEQLLLDRRRPPLLLYGQRRMGKTSLLQNLGHLLPSTIIPLFIDLQGPPSRANDHAGFLFNLARGMVEWADRQRGLALPKLRRESLVDDPFTRFDEWLDEVEKTLGDNSALLMLDEFESLDSALTTGRFNEADVLGMLRNLIQHRPRFKVMLAGSHTLDELQRWASYLINAQVIKLSYLKEDEAMRLIEHPVKDFALRYEPDASRRVWDVTRGHPYLVQLLCAEIVALKNEQEPAVRRLAKLADVEAAIPEALSHGSLFFADVERNQLDSLSVDVLRLMATRGEGALVSQTDLANEFGDELEAALDLLLLRDLIEPVNGGYRFQVELIRRWFAQPRKAKRPAGAAIAAIPARPSPVSNLPIAAK